MPMHSRTGLSSPHPVRTLLLSFLAWKTLLLIIAAASPGPGYDTSTSLLLSGRSEDAVGDLPAPLQYLVEKLTRWDAIYFVKTAHRGYLFEQEWAFGWGFSRLIARCTSAAVWFGVPVYAGGEALVGVVIAHCAHLLSVLAVFALGNALFPAHPSSFALTAALLHVIAPAGLFLSAPFAESSCALLSFSGLLLFARSFPTTRPSTTWHDLLLILSGISFGIASTFRSNGIFNGLLLLEEAFRTLFSLRRDFSISTIRRLLAAGLGGVSVGAGFLLPQYIAWSEYCGISTAGVSSLRPWCQKTIPSIYTFVQEHYWNVGPFRYWTLSNAPLFLLAAPMLSLLTVSSYWALTYQTTETSPPSNLQDADRKVKGKAPSGFPILRNLAVSQLMLTLLTLTTAHVQIITRISSAYPVWLWYLAAQFQARNSPLAGNVVRFMVMYGIIQGALFASFLPPA